MFGRSKEVKAQYEARISALSLHIADLKSQIEDMRSLVFPKMVSNAIPLVDLEADAAMSGSHEMVQPELTEEERRQMEEIDTEAAHLLAGTYS